MDEFMVRGTNCPMQRVLNLRARCLRFNKQRTAKGVVDWADDKILYKEISFSMGQLRKMVGDLIGQTRRILVEELLLRWKRLDSIRWELTTIALTNVIRTADICHIAGGHSLINWQQCTNGQAGIISNVSVTHTGHVPDGVS
jgi:hypothetical protein